MDANDVLTRHHALLRLLLPEDRPDQLSVRRGQAHTAVLGACRVVVLPRSAAAADRLAARADLLRAANRLRLDVAVPTPLPPPRIPTASDGPPFLLLTRVPGAPWEGGHLADGPVAEAVAGQVATLLERLTAEAGGQGPFAPLRAAPAGRWERFATAVGHELFPLMSPHGRQRAERELAAVRDLPPPATTAVVHGDLGAPNVLWEAGTDGLPRLSAVLDWDGAHLGDGAEDLASLAAGFGDVVLRSCLARLPSAPGLPRRVAAVRATFALQQALSAARDGDTTERDDGLRGYR